ncbi:hypothetical protein Tco_1481265 [Tanacetum coccineum]
MTGLSPGKYFCFSWSLSSTFFLSLLHLYGTCYRPSAIFSVEEFMVDARHAARSSFYIANFSWTYSNEFFIIAYRMSYDCEFFSSAQFVWVVDIAVIRDFAIVSMGQWVIFMKKFIVQFTPGLLNVNTPYRFYGICRNVREQICHLDCKTQYAIMSRRFDTSYPTGGYGVSGDQSEQNTI